MAESGLNYIMYVNTGTNSSPVWTKVAGQRAQKLDRKQQTIETTSKDSNNFKTFVAGVREWSLKLDHLIELADGGFQALHSMWKNGTLVKIQTTLSDGTTLTGVCLITDFGWDLPYDKDAVCSCALQGTGTLS